MYHTLACCHKPRGAGGGSKIKRREGGAGGGAAKRHMVMIHSFAMWVGLIIHLCGVVTAYSGSVILDVAVGGPYHPPLWFCHSMAAKHALEF